MADTTPTIQANTMSAADVKKTDAEKAMPTPSPVLHQTTNPEIAPNIPATGAMGTSGGRDGSVIPGTAAKGMVPSVSKGADTSSSDSERLGVRQAREQENAAQRARWQEENVVEPVKSVAVTDANLRQAERSSTGMANRSDRSGTVNTTSTVNTTDQKR